MKKILSILMLLVAIVTGAWATDLEVNVDQIRVSTTQAGLVKIALGDNAGFSSGKLQVSSNKTGSFTISSTNTDLYKIKKVEFATNRAPVSFKCTDTDTDVTGSDKAWEYTPSSSVDNLTFSLKSSSSSTTATVKVTLTTASTYTVEKLSGFTLENRTFSFTSTAESTNIELTDVGEYTSTIGSPNLIQCGKSSSKTYGLKFAAKSGYNLKFISFYFYDMSVEPSTSNISPDKGTYTPGAYTWTGSAENVTFTIDNKNAANYKFYNIYVGYESAAPVGPVAVTGVTVDETESVEESKTVALTATVAPANATNKNVTWSSDNPSVATVDENGVVTGVAAGTANITVKTEDGEFTDVCVVTVTAPKADSECAFGETEPSITLIGTATGTYTQEATTATGYDGTVTYDLSNNTCGASIDATTHEVTVTKSGSVTVTATAPATAAYAESSASYTLTVSGELTAESNRTWDFTDATVFTDAASGDCEYKAETYVNNVMIGNGVQLMKKTGDADNKIQRLKLMQQGSESGYYVKIKVAAHSKVTVSAVGGSSRKIYFAENAVGGTELAEYSCTESSPTDKVLEDSGDGEKVICIYNSASGNITLYSITVEPAPKEITLSSTDGKTKGFATFCGAQNFTVSGASAYKASINEDKIVLTTVGNADAVIPANNGIIIAGEKGATATVTFTTDDATADMSGNSLKGTTARVATSTLKNSATDKVVGFFKTPSAFKSYTGENFPANLAYFLLSATNVVQSFDIVFEGEATAINSINANENVNSAAPVKVIKNGKLYIGNYNVAGQLVK